MAETENITAIRDSAAAFVSAEVWPNIDELDQPEPIPKSIYKKLAEFGFLGCTVPEEYGGSGLSMREYLVVLEELSKGHSAMMLAVTMTSGPISNAILLGGSESQKDILKRMCAGDIKIAFGLSEPEAGSDAQSMRCTAERVDGGWKLNGIKQWITWGAEAEYVLVMAVTDREKRAKGGITAFLVPADTPGFKVASVDVSIGNDLLAELHFNDCVVSDDTIIGGVGNGFKVAMSSLDEGRLGVAAGCIGAAQHALNLSVEYAKNRQTFGKPLASRQAIQWMIADSAVELASCRALYEQCIQKVESEGRATTLSSMVKLTASEMVGRVADRAMQIHGASGMVRSTGIERIYRETRHYRVGEGTSEVQRMIIARELLS
ncbi:acyl-CoA dehydrogenase family protein [Aurantiacibacter sediminis]|uniref:Acyl-CoA dehydrogenase family protein n=1 Tax=Aurantiacibacter sediminis TaxID=2793064 RepID=A0ABS0N6K7_9SPHN|nr:acyl-CoA dehydrogenase family protein [Aurantiacibacter sediminis]MBH5323469.1 acyl-CoA dehydrogenase family protein [Aurantiacibacter sediminis]